MRNIGIIIAFMICCVGVAQVNVQQPPRVSGMGYGTLHDMPMFCEQLKYELTWPWSWRKKHGHMSFKRWRKAARAEVFKTMQTAPPAPVGYGYEVIACERRDGYEAQKIRFNVNRWERVVAYLLIPDAIPNSVLPAILLFHDHGAHFSIGKEKMIRPFGVDTLVMQDAVKWSVTCYDSTFVGDELAKAGYVVLCTDALFWGDRGREEGVRYDSQQALSANLLQMGTSWGSWITWDDIRSAEFLASLPFVDEEKLGCLGFSMGAYRAWMATALTDVIKAGAAICWMNDTDHLMSLDNNQNKGGSAYSMLIPGIRNLMDYPDVAVMACPKPMLFFNGTRDKLFPVDGVEICYDIMRDAWHSQKADGNLITRLWDEKHFFNRQMQQEVRTFMDKHLK